MLALDWHTSNAVQTKTLEKRTIENSKTRNMKVAVCRKEHFNAAHRLYNANWDDAKNAAVFGKCAYANFHGHNYELIVRVVGEPDVDTGYVMDTKKLSDLIKQEVHERFDHKNLNLDTVEFKNLNPTAENIAIVIYNLLRPHLADNLELKITLYETERNFVEFPVG
jgi:6-pyruvoyltetrahydropterin/6-carboxytetrahydropterin synthase